ncbi:hypothetical protein NQD34_004270 [Periophthalmus magnuspinnatus]|nr:hypothetical protein NQD34_004270 [Periophthalmus magnuspinnatus]
MNYHSKQIDNCTVKEKVSTFVYVNESVDVWTQTVMMSHLKRGYFTSVGTADTLHIYHVTFYYVENAIFAENNILTSLISVTLVFDTVSLPSLCSPSHSAFRALSQHNQHASH